MSVHVYVAFKRRFHDPTAVLSNSLDAGATFLYALGGERTVDLERVAVAAWLAHVFPALALRWHSPSHAPGLPLSTFTPRRWSHPPRH